MARPQRLSSLPHPAEHSAVPLFGWRRWWLGLFLVAVIAVGFLLRRWHAQESLWIDELHTAWTVSERLEDVAPRAIYGNQTPTYFWLEWLAVQVQGNQEITYRAISLFSGTALLLAVFLLTTQVASGMEEATEEEPPLPWLLGLRFRPFWIGLLATWLTAWDQLLIFLSQEARPYALLQFLVVCQQLTSVAWIIRPTQSRLVAALLLALGCSLLHPTARLLFLPALVGLAWLAIRKPEVGRNAFVAALITLMLSVALQYPTLLRAFSHREDWQTFIEKPTLVDLLQLFPGVQLALFPLTYLIVERLRRTKKAATTSYRHITASALLAHIIAWLVVPVVLTWILTTTDIARLWMPRYVAGCIPAVSILLAITICLLPGRWLPVLGGLGLALAVPLLNVNGPARQILAGTWESERGEDWRGALERLRLLRSGKSADMPVFVDSGLMETRIVAESTSSEMDRTYALLPVLGPYLPGDRHNLFPLPYGKPGTIPAYAWSKVRQSPRVFLLTRASPNRGTAIVSQFVTPWKATHPQLKVYRHFSSRGVQLYRVDMGKAASPKSSASSEISAAPVIRPGNSPQVVLRNRLPRLPWGGYPKEGLAMGGSPYSGEHQRCLAARIPTETTRGGPCLWAVRPDLWSLAWATVRCCLSHVLKR